MTGKINSMLKVFKRVMGLSCDEKVLDFCERDYSMFSGERQTGAELSLIRYDHRVRYSMIIEYIKKYYERTHDLVGLDIFCANGYGSFMMSEELQCHILGIDACGEAIDMANRFFSNTNTLYINKIFPFSLPSGLFDFVTSIESIEHIKSPCEFLSSISNSLKTGGYLFLSTPNESLISHECNPNKYHYCHYTYQEVIDLVSSVTELELVTWFGQNVYEIQNGIADKLLPESEMELSEKVAGQTNVFVFMNKATKSM